MSRSRGFRLMSFGSMVLAGLALAVGSLTLTERQAQAAPEDDIVAMLEDLQEAWNDGDAETVVSLFTEEGLADQFEVGEGDDPAAAITETMGFTGALVSITVSDLFVTSGNATGIVDARFEGGFAFYEEWEFFFLDGGWKIGEAEPAARPIPEGVPVVDMTLQEYAFVYNQATLEAADGNFAFDVVNIGQEEHEVVILGIEGSGSLLDLLQAADPESEDIPEGLELVTFGGFFEPGQDGTVVLDQPLSPGRYGLVCFLPAPDGTPHAFLGMVSEFTISGGGPVDDDDDDGVAPIRPPSTGDAGLLGTGAGTATWLLLGVALTLVLGGTAGLVAVRRSTGT